MAKHPKGIRSAAGLAAVDHVRKLVAHLEGVEEAVDKFGHTSFRVRDKPFVMLGDGNRGPSLSFKAEPFTQSHLIEHRGFVRTRYIGQHGWTSVPSVPPDDWAEVEELVVDAYLLVAPRTIAKKLRADREGRA